MIPMNGVGVLDRWQKVYPDLYPSKPYPQSMQVYLTHAIAYLLYCSQLQVSLILLNWKGVMYNSS